MSRLWYTDEVSKEEEAGYKEMFGAVVTDEEFWLTPITCIYTRQELDDLAILKACGWDVEILKEETIFSKRALEYKYRMYMIEKEIHRNYDLMVRMRERNKRPIGMVLMEIENAEWFKKLTPLQCMNFNELWIEKVNEYAEAMGEVDLNFDDLVDLYKSGILSEEAVGSYSRLKQIELMMAAEDYIDINYGGEDGQPKVKEKLKDTALTDNYLMSLIYGDEDDVPKRIPPSFLDEDDDDDVEIIFG